jgi:hypothetical protein
MNLRQILLEITLDLSNAYEYKFVGGTNWEYNFEISTGTKYSVEFAPLSDGDSNSYERIYHTTNKNTDPAGLALTNENQALKVNATVMKITLDFLSKNKDWHTILIAPLSEGRKKLVKVLLDKNLPSKYFYDEVEEDGSILIYRKYSGLNELTLDLSNAYDYKFMGGKNWKYDFTISAGTNYSVIFKHTLKDELNYYERIYITTNKDYFTALTNENQALKVNATVMKITLDFLEQNKDWDRILINPLSEGRKKLVKVLLDKNLPSKYEFKEIEKNPIPSREGDGSQIIIYKKNEEAV